MHDLIFLRILNQIINLQYVIISLYNYRLTCLSSTWLKQHLTGVTSTLSCTLHFLVPFFHQLIDTLKVLNLLPILNSVLACTVVTRVKDSSSLSIYLLHADRQQLKTL